MPKPYIPNDNWSRKAAEEGYRARSVYKLQEIDERYSLVHSGMKVLDIGAAPGSWLQYVSKKIGPAGLAIGVDLKEIKHVAANVKTAVCDINDAAALDRVLAESGIKTVDLLLSDIAPNTTGIKDVDQWRSIELSRQVVAVARRVLKRSGFLVMKVFRGKNFDAFTAEVKAEFPRFKVANPEASRDRSREVYIVCGR